MSNKTTFKKGKDHPCFGKKGKNHPVFGKHWKLSETTKRQMSLSQKGRIVSLETKKRISETLKGKFIGEKSPRWKGGEYKSRGYCYIIQYSHPFANKNNYIRRSRLIVEKYLNRYLLPTEVIHHINGIKDDDRPENLYLFYSQSQHKKYHYNPYPLISNLIDYLEKPVK